MDKELEELDYELRMQGLAETTSTHRYWSTSESHLKQQRSLAAEGVIGLSYREYHFQVSRLWFIHLVRA